MASNRSCLKKSDKYQALIYACGVPRMTELLDIATWPPLWASLSSSPTSKSCLVFPKIHRWEFMFVYKLWTVESQCAMSVEKVFASRTARLKIFLESKTFCVQQPNLFKWGTQNPVVSQFRDFKGCKTKVLFFNYWLSDRVITHWAVLDSSSMKHKDIIYWAD